MGEDTVFGELSMRDSMLYVSSLRSTFLFSRRCAPRHVVVLLSWASSSTPVSGRVSCSLALTGAQISWEGRRKQHNSRESDGYPRDKSACDRQPEVRILPTRETLRER